MRRVDNWSVLTGYEKQMFFNSKRCAMDTEEPTQTRQPTKYYSSRDFHETVSLDVLKDIQFSCPQCDGLITTHILNHLRFTHDYDRTKAESEQSRQTCIYLCRTKHEGRHVPLQCDYCNDWSCQMDPHLLKIHLIKDELSRKAHIQRLKTNFWDGQNVLAKDERFTHITSVIEESIECSNVNTRSTRASWRFSDTDNFLSTTPVIDLRGLRGEENSDGNDQCHVSGRYLTRYLRPRSRKPKMVEIDASIPRNPCTECDAEVPDLIQHLQNDHQYDVNDAEFEFSKQSRLRLCKSEHRGQHLLLPCQECGLWFCRLDLHLKNEHQMKHHERTKMIDDLKVKYWKGNALVANDIDPFSKDCVFRSPKCSPNDDDNSNSNNKTTIPFNDQDTSLDTPLLCNNQALNAIKSYPDVDETKNQKASGIMDQSISGFDKFTASTNVSTKSKMPPQEQYSGNSFTNSENSSSNVYGISTPKEYNAVEIEENEKSAKVCELLSYQMSNSKNPQISISEENESMKRTLTEKPQNAISEGNNSIENYTIIIPQALLQEQELKDRSFQKTISEENDLTKYPSVTDTENTHATVSQENNSIVNYRIAIPQSLLQVKDRNEHPDNPFCFERESGGEKYVNGGETRGSIKAPPSPPELRFEQRNADNETLSVNQSKKIRFAQLKKKMKKNEALRQYLKEQRSKKNDPDLSSLKEKGRLFKKKFLKMQRNQKLGKRFGCDSKDELIENRPKKFRAKSVPQSVDYLESSDDQLWVPHSSTISLNNRPSNEDWLHKSRLKTVDSFGCFESTDCRPKRIHHKKSSTYSSSVKGLPHTSTDNRFMKPSQQSRTGHSQIAEQSSWKGAKGLPLSSGLFKPMTNLTKKNNHLRSSTNYGLDSNKLKRTLGKPLARLSADLQDSAEYRLNRSFSKWLTSSSSDDLGSINTGLRKIPELVLSETEGYEAPITFYSPPLYPPLRQIEKGRFGVGEASAHHFFHPTKPNKAVEGLSLKKRRVEEDWNKEKNPLAIIRNEALLQSQENERLPMVDIMEFKETVEDISTVAKLFIRKAPDLKEELTIICKEVLADVLKPVKFDRSL